jgi:hypothetical protein
VESISRAERRRSRREFAKRAQWESLEEFTRSRIQSWLEDLLEEEVAELLGPRQVGATGGGRRAGGLPQRAR